MTSSELPESVAAYLRDVADGVAAGSESELAAQARKLLDEHEPEPKTLADIDGCSVVWDRVFVDRDNDHMAESESPEVYVTRGGVGLSLARSGGTLTPWPDIQGIDPRPLLNDGWQIRPFREVPDDWVYAYDHEGRSQLKKSYTPNVGLWGTTALVFCRPPRNGDDQ